FDGDDLISTGGNIVAEAMDLDNLETGELDLGSIDIEDAEDKIETGGTLDDSQSFDLSSLNDSMADLTLDIENLDLDLDLDIPEDKK
ncbi:MAG: hypothetical protein GX846_01030, partial [Deltaproteobacteria bacterium]|nr:hypothetical protein [Deltaproteobacteria bacterium]